jgi:hypothetical protein
MESNEEKKKKKMNFTRFANLLYEASSSLVPGTGELYNTEYTGDVEENKDDGIKG